MKIMVTGASGKFGGKVISFLLKEIKPEQLAVSVRNPEKVRKLKELGVDVRQGDFDQPEGLAKAFEGIDRLLIVSTDGDNETRIRQHGNAVNAAKAAGVGHIVYTSVANAAENPLFLAPVHRFTEESIIKSGIPYTFLRNNWYLENESSGFQAAKAGAPWVTAAGNGKVGWAIQRDYAEAAARVLLGSGHDNKIYELSGPLTSQGELVQILGEVIGKGVPVMNVDINVYSETMKGAGVPEQFLPMMVQIQEGIAAGALAQSHSDFEKILGRPVTPLKKAIEEILKQSN